MTPGAHQVAAMRLAIDNAQRVKGTTYPNPPVGAVILSADGQIAGVGGTEPPGLEPCNHHGRTPPCVDALLAAGITDLVYAVADPDPPAAGGAGRLAAAGVTVTAGVCAEDVAAGPLREWLHKKRTGRPHVTWKFAASIDGRSAAADGSSRWITGDLARADVHRRRAAADAIVVGTGTVLADDPSLTARLADGSPAARQPLRVVVGERAIPQDAAVLRGDPPTLLVHTDDPREVLRALAEHTDVLLEGGPTLAGAFIRAGLVDRILAYLAPLLLGGPVTAVDDVGVSGIADARRWRFDGVERIGPDVLLSLVPGDG